LACGAEGEGSRVTSAGIVPTPAVAHLARALTYDIGVVISASHNPFQDNGIKVFSGGGEKFTELIERQVEAIVADSSWTARSGEADPVANADLVDVYLGHLREVLHGVVLPARFKLAIDCANGATAAVAPVLFRSLGIDVVVMGDKPDGRNINLESGSTCPHAVARAVLERGCDAGVAFDGDGDRAIFVDNRGEVVNGDAVLFMCARQLKREGRLKGDAVVATVMSNVGLEVALRRLGIGLVRCPVGDKYVMEAMLERDLSLGGEQSGHIIFSDYLFTGDGLCTALNVLRILALTGESLAELAAELVTWPQILLNVPVRERVALEGFPAIAGAVARVEERVEKQGGRLLVRYSGTEPLLRVMLEGEHEQEIRAWAEEIAQAVRTHLG
jgi:phosphoglucosamine mutase